MSHRETRLRSRLLDVEGIVEVTKSDALRDLTGAAIIDSAARLLADRGDAARMDDIASAAGVSRATLYRYFPSREALLRAMTAASVEELAGRIEDAKLDKVSFEEGIARLTRALMATGSRFKALGVDSAAAGEAHPGFDLKVVAPIRAMFDRAVDSGAVRADFSADVLVDLFSGLIRGAFEAIATGRSGVEETAATATSLFMRGAGAPSSDQSKSRR